MNRLSWDSTAPRRPTGKRLSPNPRPEGLLEAEAELIRVAWDKPQRIEEAVEALARSQKPSRPKGGVLTPP